MSRSPNSNVPRFLPTAAPFALPEALPLAELQELLAPLDDASSEIALQATRYTDPRFGIPLGRWVRTQSTFMWAWAFQPYGDTGFGDLQMEFISGFIGLWTDVDVAHVIGLHQAYSKGMYHHAWDRYHGPYTTIRPSIYFGEDVETRKTLNNENFYDGAI